MDSSKLKNTEVHMKFSNDECSRISLPLCGKSCGFISGILPVWVPVALYVQDTAWDNVTEHKTVTQPPNYLFNFSSDCYTMETFRYCGCNMKECAKMAHLALNLKTWNVFQYTDFFLNILGALMNLLSPNFRIEFRWISVVYLWKRFRISIWAGKKNKLILFPWIVHE